jgi:hypothetical protein
LAKGSLAERNKRNEAAEGSRAAKQRNEAVVAAAEGLPGDGGSGAPCSMATIAISLRRFPSRPHSLQASHPTRFVEDAAVHGGRFLEDAAVEGTRAGDSPAAAVEGAAVDGGAAAAKSRGGTAAAPRRTSRRPPRRRHLLQAPCAKHPVMIICNSRAQRVVAATVGGAGSCGARGRVALGRIAEGGISCR